MDFATYLFSGVGLVACGYLLIEHLKSRRQQNRSKKKHDLKSDDLIEGVEVSTTGSSATEQNSAEMDDDREESEVINPICRIKGHDFEDSEAEVTGIPPNEMAWLMGKQPTYRRYRRCKREGCTKRMTQLRTNLVTKGPWKDIW